MRDVFDPSSHGWEERCELRIDYSPKHFYDGRFAGMHSLLPEFQEDGNDLGVNEVVVWVIFSICLLSRY